jgi:hypothetical protein
MRYNIINGTKEIHADSYSLVFPTDRPFAYLKDKNGALITELFYLSSIHPLMGRDDTVAVGSWVVSEEPGAVVLTMCVESSAWEKKAIIFRCLPDRISYEIEITGQGSLTEVNYFGGYYSGQIRWGSGFFWSGQKFLQGFNPEPNSDEKSYFLPGEGSVIDLMGVPLPGKSHWFFTPPPFCYAFESKSGWLGFGICAQSGAHQFTEYSYHARSGAFHLSCSYEGHTIIDGTYRLPAVVIEFGADEYDVLQRHVDSVRSTLQLEKQPLQPKPVWWYEPIFCGWGAQCHVASLQHGKAPDFACQEQYDTFLTTLSRSEICPGIVVLDDKWQATYGDNCVDENKWPDLRGFIRNQHNQGRKILLWLKAWDPEGIPAEECIRNARGDVVSIDPSNPAFEQRLRASVRRMLSSTGYDADGFKIDFSARIPSGPGTKTWGHLWGLELMHRYLEIINQEAKQTKQDALIMTHTPHTYLSDVVDMIRLNDINVGTDVNQAMTMRARVASIACPDAIIDTDNWPMTDKAIWRGYLQLQPKLGVPSLYYTHFIDSSKEQLTEEDYQLIRSVWAEHRAKTSCLEVNIQVNSL